MPLYDYECEVHGMFEAFNSMALSQEAKGCHQCGLLSKRIVSAPNVRSLNPLISQAMERNEKSRFSPHVCKSSCHHVTDKTHNKALEPRKPKLQSYQGKRPWVIEHA